MAMLLASSCVGDVRSASRDPFLEPLHQIAEVPVKGNQAPQADAGPIALAAHTQAEPVGVVRLAEWRAPAASIDARRRVEQAAHVTPTVPRIDLANSQVPAELCFPHSQGGFPDSQSPALLAFSHGPALFGVDVQDDEYLFDGGDRALPVHYDRFNRLGLDTEDAVAEYSDHLGNRYVKPTNRVAIYSPRFGAVRTIAAPGEGTSVEFFALSVDTSRTAGLRNRRTPHRRTQHDAAGRVDVRARASGVGSETGRRGVHQATTLVLHAKPVKAAEDLAFVGTGRFMQAERARLATGIQAAAVWSRANSPMIVAQAEGLQEAYASFRPQELVGLSDEHLKPGELRIIKLADRGEALPGEVVTFTIRYDNLGDRELRHIRIVDNLTPRLEFVEGSATSDRAGRLDVEDNGEGSLVLEFVVDDPLPGGEGGVVTFEARVR